MTNGPITAADIMTTKLVTLSPKMDIFDSIGLLLRHQISGAPVIDEQRNFLGIFSEKCCMSILVKTAYDSLPTSEIEAFFDRDALTIDENLDLLNIAMIFFQTNYRRLPVLREGKLVGQVSRRDVLQSVHNMIKVATDRESALLYLSSLVDRSEAPIG